MVKPQTRRKARALAVQALYQWQFATGSVATIAAQYLLELNPKKVDRAYFQDLLHNTVKHVERIDTTMAPLLDRKLEELHEIERAILRLAIYELLYRLDVPYKVVINEALELAKKFGSTEGYKYVNGVLDRVVRVTSRQELGQDAKRGEEAPLS